MKKRTKTRTHKKISEEEEASIPKSMVIHLGASLANHSLSQLVKDFRLVMSPYTAINLRERKNNKLKDFIVMAGPLGVTNLFVFNQSENGNLSLRLGKMPRGPMFQFKIDQYSLMKDVAKVLKRAKSISKDGIEYMHPPLLVMNGFLTKGAPHEKLLLTIFQNLFPPIQPQFTKLGSIKRVLMINYKDGKIEIRHYSIDTKTIDNSRNIKKLIQSHQLNKNLPKLGKSEDIADLVLDPYNVGLTSDSEVEDDAVFDQPTNVVKKKVVEAEEGEEKEGKETRKKAIKLTELGPRINMTLMKIEEGLTASKTIYHSTVTKSKKEQEQLEAKAQEKRQLREERRKRQAENVEKKKKKKVKIQGHEDDEEEDEEENSEINPDDHENDSDLFSDIEK